MNNELSKPVVDTHFHVFRAGDGLPHARYKPGYDATMASWQQASSASGVQRGVLVQTSFMGTNNTRLLHELGADPEHLRGIAVIAPDADPAQLRQWHAAGVRGIRLNLAGASHDIPEWRTADKVWAAISELGWHVEVHTDVGALPGVLRQLPGDMPLVLDHMAKPAQATRDDPTVQAVRLRSRQATVHIKLSGAYRLGGRSAAQIAQLWLQELGVEHLLWGSDWPCTNHEPEAVYAHLFAQLAQWVGPGQTQQVLARNPAALYWGT